MIPLSIIAAAVWPRPRPGWAPAFGGYHGPPHTRRFGIPHRPRACRGARRRHRGRGLDDAGSLHPADQQRSLVQAGTVIDVHEVEAEAVCRPPPRQGRAAESRRPPSRNTSGPPVPMDEDAVGHASLPVVKSRRCSPGPVVPCEACRIGDRRLAGAADADIGGGAAIEKVLLRCWCGLPAEPSTAVPHAAGFAPAGRLRRQRRTTLAEAWLSSLLPTTTICTGSAEHRGGEQKSGMAARLARASPAKAARHRLRAVAGLAGQMPERRRHAGERSVGGGSWPVVRVLLRPHEGLRPAPPRSGSCPRSRSRKSDGSGAPTQARAHSR